MIEMSQDPHREALAAVQQVQKYESGASNGARAANTGLNELYSTRVSRSRSSDRSACRQHRDR